MVTNSDFSTANLSLVIFALGSLLYGQVAIEPMRKADLTPGLHTNLNLDFSMLAGNSSHTRVRTGLRFDYLKGAVHSFLTSSFQQGSLIEEYFVNKGFAHLRRTQSLRGRLFVEGFLQWEYNDFIRLKDRRLAGGGLRVRWLEERMGEKEAPSLQVHTGTGFMWERERIRNTKDPTDALKDLSRSTNYVTLGWTPDERVLLQLTTYFQPDVRRPKDFRVLLDGHLAFTLAGKLSATIKLSTRYDNEPPIVIEKDGLEKGIKKYDVELTSGLTYTF
ncbi:MAG: DUF481 domain-containing protein [Fidelibacterota bacterium]|nr:MAG: DUF481 domain-containing protein [Candidatus Neomarinimicrobiota bacterium]